MNFKNAQRMRKAPTHEEAIMWEELRGRKLLNYKFRRQHPIRRYIADFYCHELNLAIELDGGYHDTVEMKCKDEKRTEELNGLEVIVYRITNKEFSNRSQAIEKLAQFIRTLKNSSPSGEVG